MGNQASDADSIITAICMAYLTRHQLQAAGGAEPADWAEAGTIVLPMVQCPREDFCLRAETVALLRGAGLTEELLTFGGNATDDALSDGDLRKLQAEGRLRLTLVDHNAMTPRQQKLKLPEAVVRILDHHKDDGHSPSVTGDARRIAYGEAAGLAKGAALGSCCTLVAHLLLDEAPALLRAEPLLGKLLLAGILIDTANLQVIPTREECTF